MSGSFFRSLEREAVAYLLISGQATVLYGAAVFSEDIDLWVKPTAANATALLAALSSVKATYYKLTPPLNVAYLARGHGFHFRVPGTPEYYLDVVGRPPRVPTFDEVRARATVIPTDWGDIPTIGIRHLAALKTTQRLGDYPIISQLVLRCLEDVSDLSDEDCRWAIANLHTLDELEEFLRTHPAALRVCEAPPLRMLAAHLARGSPIPAGTRMGVERWLSERILALRQADHDYWAGIIMELRAWHRTGKLMPVGSPVCSPRKART
jgi:hypothetical protein